MRAPAVSLPSEKDLSHLLGRNKHGIVVAQSVRKRAPLNPEAAENRENAAFCKNNHFKQKSQEEIKSC